MLDASAAVAIVLGEDGAEELDRLLGTNDAVTPAATLVEVSLVVEARAGLAGAAILDELLRDGHVEVVDVDESLARASVRAWRRFGKGNHRAALNFGDCFVYALAEATGHPILCTGNDFAQTDLEVLPAR